MKLWRDEQMVKVAVIAEPDHTSDLVLIFSDEVIELRRLQKALHAFGIHAL